MSIRDACLDALRKIPRIFADEPKSVAYGGWEANLESASNTRWLIRFRVNPRYSALYIINR